MSSTSVATAFLLCAAASFSGVFTSPIPDLKLDEAVQAASKQFGAAKPQKNDTDDTGSIMRKRSDGGGDDGNWRQNKMFGFYGHYPPMPVQPAFYPQADYFNDFGAGDLDGVGPTGLGSDLSNFVSDNEDLVGRANHRSRPHSSTKNSPIFYIRLPATPYMFVPGLGYVSQPPSMAPIAPVAPPPPPPPSPSPFSPFFNVPLNFMSNGKPSSIYQWSGMPQFSNPLAYPHRPQRPYRPSTTQFQDSKITRLKGPFPFNGRPEDVFILPNPYQQHQQHQQQQQQQQQHHQPQFNSIFSNPFQNFF